METTKITCLIVDDEPMALNLIESYVTKTPFLELSGRCTNAYEALEIISAQPIDLVFLDIQMPGLNGLELSKTIRKKTRVIFTTAFDQYALEGYKVDAVDYLLKPFDYQEFLTAATKALDWFTLMRNGKKPVVKDEFLFVKADYKQIKINFDDIYYFEGLKDYVKIWLKSQPRPVLTLMSLKSLEESLPAELFMRVHRSFIISLHAIEAIERNRVIINKQHIVIADNYKEKFYSFVEGYSIP
jgi:two-component system, LytTR family, response regulator LytT